MSEKIRLQKYLAQCGIGSRRKCEKYIEENRIKVDGEIIEKQGYKIDPNKHKITFDGKIVKPQKKHWIMLNKPPKYICSSKDQGDKLSFLHLLPKNFERLFSVGRLDYLSEGLLFVTNDGDLANKIIHPRYEIKKIYEVVTKEKINNELKQKMLDGIKFNEEILKVLKINELNNRQKNNKHIYEVTLGEGRNRHIRRMLAELNIHIASLKRIKIGPISLGSLKSGDWRYLTNEELNKLKKLND